MVVTSIAIGAIVLSSCGKAAELGTEQLIESQSGGDVDLDLNDDGGFSVETEDGSMTVDEDGNFVVTDVDGKAVTGNANEEGDFDIESDDGDFRIDSSGEIPDEWPDGVPEPEGMSGATSSVQNADGVLGISVTGSADARWWPRSPRDVAPYSAAHERRQGPHCGEQPDAGIDDAARHRRAFEVRLIELALRRLDDGEEIANEKRTTEREHQPCEEIFSQEHAHSMPS